MKKVLKWLQPIGEFLLAVLQVLVVAQLVLIALVVTCISAFILPKAKRDDDIKFYEKLFIKTSRIVAWLASKLGRAWYRLFPPKQED